MSSLSMEDGTESNSSHQSNSSSTASRSGKKKKKKGGILYIKCLKNHVICSSADHVFSHRVNGAL